MTVYNLGSINIDNFYAVEHLPKPGETLASKGFRTGLGGKGANQSIAAARAGAEVFHIGAVGREGIWCVERLANAGVDVTHVATTNAVTGHANICVDQVGENMIVLFAGTNAELELDLIDAAFTNVASGDVLLLQNETNLSFEAATKARTKDIQVIYSAAPFSADAATKMLPVTDLLVLNEVEAAQLCTALGVSIDQIEVPSVLITRGTEGSEWRSRTAPPIVVDAFPVAAVDTTGAGDCFIGYVAAGLDHGMAPSEAMKLGAAASAIQVTRHGTSDAIPTRAEVDSFINENTGND